MGPADVPFELLLGLTDVPFELLLGPADVPFELLFCIKLQFYCVCFWTLPVVKLRDVVYRYMPVEHIVNDNDGGKPK